MAQFDPLCYLRERHRGPSSPRYPTTKVMIGCLCHAHARVRMTQLASTFLVRSELVRTREVILGVGLIKELVRVDDLHRNLLAVGVGHERVERLRAEARIAFACSAQFAVNYSLQAVLLTVD